MFQLSNAEVAALHARAEHRRNLVLRETFVAAEAPDTLAGPYFDDNIDKTSALQALNEDDKLLLLRIGFAWRLPLEQTPDMQECLRRGKWYGRRHWLKNRFATIAAQRQSSQRDVPAKQ